MSIPVVANSAEADAQTSIWAAEDLARIAAMEVPEAPLLGVEDAQKVIGSLDLWDIWPLQSDDGSLAEVAGGSLWLILSAPCLDDPNLRHDVARTRLLHRIGGAWHDCGNLFPDALNPGFREWSGSTRFDAKTGRVTAFFTATGRRGNSAANFEQRLFQTVGTLNVEGPQPAITGWSVPQESVINDGRYYVDLAVDQGVPGRIRGFRDPYWFRDPADGAGWLLFTGSLAGAISEYCGVVGLAAARGADGDAGFDLLPPLVSADGLANEMERPHMIVRNGLYYLFWSSQQSIFAPDGPIGPTGLYGMVGPSMRGPFTPLNGSGLVIANPVDEPRQAYCWQVLDTLDVVSFVDHWGLQGRDPALHRAQFGGTIAPMLKIAIEGDTTRLLGLAG